jgi:predicted metal-dependent phosphoesterase TrpH
MLTPQGVHAKRLFRADLHVHSARSGPGHLRAGFPLGQGEEPEALYQAARARRLDLIALTDLDTIDGCLDLLDRHPGATDLLVSEEVAARDPRTGCALPVLLYDIDERRHREAQRLKGDVRNLISWARCEGIPAALGSVLAVLPGNRSAGGYLREILEMFELFELKSGLAGRRHNELMSRLVHEVHAGRRFGVTAGSGAHTRRDVGRALTVSRAAGREEFLADLRQGRTWAAGRDGTLGSASAEIVRMLGQGCRAALGRGAGEADRRGPRRRARALLALPLALAGTPLLAHGLVRARHALHVRRLRRRLDRLDVTRFQEKARAYETVGMTAGPEARGEV